MFSINGKLGSVAKTFAGGAAAAAIIALAAAPAQAATTYTPDGGPEANFVGTNVSFTDVQANETLTCQQFDLAGSVDDPGVSRAYDDPANPAGTLDQLNSDNCTHPLAGKTKVTPTGTWHVTVTGDEDQDGWPAKLTNLSADVEAAQCFFEVDGEVSGHFDEATQVFTPESSTVHISNTPSGLVCGLLGLQQNDDIAIGGYWTNTPPSGSTDLTITNP